jgi:protein involved in polysaccharide export with SLBB domain
MGFYWMESKGLTIKMGKNKLQKDHSLCTFIPSRKDLSRVFGKWGFPFCRSRLFRIKIQDKNNPATAIFPVGFFWLTAVLCLLFFATGCGHQVTRVEPQIVNSPRSWERHWNLTVSGKYRSVALGDLDGDGNQDVVGGSSIPGTVAIWYGDGAGNMSEPVFLPFKGDVRSIAVADLNEDGLADIVLSVQREISGLMVWASKPGREWEKGVSPTNYSSYEGVATGDINGDGHVDIAAAKSSADSEGGIKVWLGDGTGRWVSETGPAATGVYMDVVIADINKDGRLDLVGSGWGTYGALRVWMGNGIGGWSARPEIGKGSYYKLSVVDIDGDENLDILAGSYRAGGQVYLGNGLGGFIKSLGPGEKPSADGKKKFGTLFSKPDLPSFWHLLPVDIDRDGVLDIVAGSADSRGIEVWKHEISGKWVPLEGDFPMVGTYYSMVVGDVNGDEIDDIFAASFGEGIKVLVSQAIEPDILSIPGNSKTPDSEEVSDVSMEEGNSVYMLNDQGIPEYKIGSHDVLEITLWQATTANRELISVRPSGKISFGFIDDLSVDGLTVSQIDQLLTHRLKEFIKNPRIEIQVKEYFSKWATVMGAIEIDAQGAGSTKYPLSGRSTVLNMLSEYFRIAPDANLSDIRVRRKNGQSVKIDLFKAITFGDRSQDLIVDDGDLVFVPRITAESNRVYVFGEVSRPGIYTFTGTEMRLIDAVTQAGGFTIFAKEKSTKIIRGDVTNPEVISADLKSLIEEGNHTQNVALASGDLVYIPRSIIGNVNLFVKRIAPLLRLLSDPGDAMDSIENISDNYNVVRE